MPDSLTSEPESVFVCDCDEWMRKACLGEPFYRELEDKRYCVLHFPGKDKGETFEKSLERKLDKRDFDFSGIWFPREASFSGFHFESVADFDHATFNATADFSNVIFQEVATFDGATVSGDADFSSVTFKAGANFRFTAFYGETDFNSATYTGEATFRYATFRAAAYFDYNTFSEQANFESTTFTGEAYFRSTTFKSIADFTGATFVAKVTFHSSTFAGSATFRSAIFNKGAHFTGATLKGCSDFCAATFADALTFRATASAPMFGSDSLLNLQHARIDKPDQVSFLTLVARPHWFVNVDARKFEFTNVDWKWRSIDHEIQSLRSTEVSSPHRMLSIAYRQLAVNAEENHRYEEASKFRYMAMEARRLESWRGFAPWRLSWWYWLASGYGERVWQAFFVLLGILLLSALLYNHVGFARWEPKVASESDVIVAKRDDVGAPLKFSRTLTYSAGVMILQKPEPRPATTAAQTVVLLETILGPVQAALLALAIRRKFMR